MSTREQPTSSLVFTQFGGMDTSAARQCIDDYSFAWLEGVMPIGNGNLAVIPGTANVLGGVPAGSIVSQFDCVLSGVLYKVVQTLVSPGSYNIYAIQVSNGQITTVTTGVAFSYFAVWQNTHLLFVNSANYSRWNASTGTISLSNTFVGGPIAVWGTRVWIVATTPGRTVQYTAPNAFNDFTAADAGGNVVITNAALQGPIVQMLPAGDWMYLVGAGCVVAFSEIQVLNSSPPVTIFNVTQVSDTTGITNYQNAFAFGSSLWLLTGRGIVQFQGLTEALPASPYMDGIFAGIDLTKNGGFAVSTILGKTCLLCLVYYTPNAKYYLLAMFDNKWFVIGGLPANVTSVSWADLNSSSQAYITDAGAIYAVASDTTVPVSGQIQTKLYDGGSPITMKQVLKMGMEVNLISIDGEITMQLDCLNPDKGLQPVPYDVIDLSSNYALGYQFIRRDASNSGLYLGTTVNFTLTGGSFQSFMWNGGYLNEWP